MAGKRQATTELNHQNWDQDDPSEHEEMGSFKTASKDVLEKRVIRTAKRRSQVSSDEPKKGVFSGFGGFNKTQPSSFDFLANLTNGNKPTNGASTNNDSVTSSLFTSKPTSPGSGLFGASSSPPKSTFGSTLQTSSPFSVSSTKTEATAVFTASKADSTVSDSPFKSQPPTNSPASTFSKSPTSSTPKVTSSIFGVSSSTAIENKTLFSSSSSTPFKMLPVSSTTNTVQNYFGITTKATNNTNDSDKKVEDPSNEKKLKYYAKLKGLNESVSDWIKKHVEQTPLCILSPIFKDYEKYLKDIQEEYQGPDKEEKKAEAESKTETKTDSSNTKTITTSVFGNTASSVFSSNNTNTKTTLGTLDSVTTSANKPSTFSFGVNTSSNTATTTTTSSGFSFGVTSSTVANNVSSPFTLTTSTATTNQTSSPFSFGIGKPFSFSPTSVQASKPEDNKPDNEDEDEPPKVEFTPVAEENSVYDKRCKIFVKKDGNFADKGLGTLYIKKIEESGKHQLLVRANTNLGTVLLNTILATAIPTQRMGKNNVMLVCIPTPDAKPPPTPVLIRVKTGEEADELLETLNKYKA